MEKTIFFVMALSWGVFGVARASNLLQTPPSQNDNDFRWLYEKILPEEAQRNFPVESWKSFRVHLKDSYQKFPDPLEITSQNRFEIPETPFRVQGTLLYLGMVRKKYVFNVLPSDSGEWILNVRVNFKNATDQDWISFSQKIQEAERIWNQSREFKDFKYRFHFELVRDPTQAHFSVVLMDSTRGPYDQAWSRGWNSVSVAHELGHMMGLGDEYQTLNAEIDCYRPSLMCLSAVGSPLKHHYYFILRRLVRSAPSGEGQFLSWGP